MSPAFAGGSRPQIVADFANSIMPILRKKGITECVGELSTNDWVVLGVGCIKGSLREDLAGTNVIWHLERADFRGTSLSLDKDTFMSHSYFRLRGERLSANEMEEGFSAAFKALTLEKSAGTVGAVVPPKF